MAFIYPDGPADESTPPAHDVPGFLYSALRAEDHLRHLNKRERRGIALRASARSTAQRPPISRPPIVTPFTYTSDAATAAALTAPGGVYNVVHEADPVGHTLFTQATGWRPQHNNH